MQRLVDRRLLFVTGKGGVGKTIVSAALGARAARAGKTVLLCELAAQSAFGRIFGRPIESVPVSVAPSLWATNLDPPRCLVDFLTRFVKVERLARALVRNSVARHFFDAAPGVLESVVLERVARLTRGADGETRYDLVVVDLPATGHAITFLDVPRRLSQVLVAGRLAETLAELADELARPGFAELALVTQAEEMPVQETIELWQGVRERLSVALEVVFVNRVRRTHLRPAVAEWLRGAPRDQLAPLEPLEAGRLVAIWEAQERLQLARLEREIAADLVEIPWVAERSHDRDLIDRVAADWEPSR